MQETWQILVKAILLFCVSLEAKKTELPLCPSNMQYFPQNLPMHCRMPATLAPPSIESLRLPMPGFPAPLPGFPAPAPGFPAPVPGLPAPIPGAIPQPMPMPMAPIAPAHKLPVIVMPFYSPDTKQSQFPPPPPPLHKKHRTHGSKRKPKHRYSSDEDCSDTDTSSDESSDRSSENAWWGKSRQSRRSNRHKSKRRSHQNQALLTPILQYVTKDGYVIFEKQISKGEAKDWLVNKNGDSKTVTPSKNENNLNSREPRDDNEDTKILTKEDENVEVRTETSPHYVHRKKNFKRKLSKKA